MTKQEIEFGICDFLDTIPNLVYQAGFFRDKSFFDIVGAFPGGRAFFIKIKIIGENITMEETAFLQDAVKTGAIAFTARSPVDVFRVFSTGGIVNH